jgi:hypothetical protein
MAPFFFIDMTKRTLRPGTVRMIEFLEKNGNFIYRMRFDMGQMECWQYGQRRVLLLIGTAGGFDLFFDERAQNVDELLEILQRNFQKDVQP